MATGGRGSGVVCYNAQVAVETENHLIITHEVTNVVHDRSQLARVGNAAKTVMRADTLEAVADIHSTFAWPLNYRQTPCQRFYTTKT